MDSKDLFRFGATLARETFRIDPLRSPVVSSRPGPSAACCATFAVVDEVKDGQSIWRCPMCGRLWAVPNK